MGNIIGKPVPKIHLSFYLSWVNIWLSLPDPAPGQDTTDLTPTEQVKVFLQESSSPLPSYSALKRVASSFRRSLDNGQIRLGGGDAPSCSVTNLASADYDPNSNCTCNGLYPVPADADIACIVERADCTAIRNTHQALQTVLKRKSEWNTTSLFSPRNLIEAVTELLLANVDVQDPPTTCQDPAEVTNLRNIRAPDRRPSPQNDTVDVIHRQLYPAAEDVKFCTDAKYYFVLGAIHSDPAHDGLIRAIADAGNDILVADYCEVADEATLKVLQQTGAAAVAFLKLCVLSGLFSEWAFDNMMASMLHFRVLGYYRDHARGRLPAGVYGSRMTSLTAHRYVDLGLFFAVASASVWTKRQVNETEYTLLSIACTLINDLVDLRSDTARKQRENVVLRGVRGNLCEYLDRVMFECLETATLAVQMNPTYAYVLMAFCNWAVMSSHHKVYEVSTQVSEIGKHDECLSRSRDHRRAYWGLLEALAPYGTLGKEGPRVGQTRAELDFRYGVCRSSSTLHAAWLADITRSLLEPRTLRRIVDVVHFEWTGCEGEVEYCP
ncbi:hypothetical protein BO83DRAFT_305002 [Aspergillus eucalypticola CBS 122712]|uniref:Uncharacterized protein n=1 Tax=Aspergillus eucalypticola (strain CBS 122712 / IBT 29274) TaxID=1448314 RepID=A0A317WA60_ASPEC|nr:uncharacterized protein BO83DRAFT_305002 [Aspergillus eucalypticola CBS 122712]PWY82775.1 hypothetical protein BO83DRAFT_305002 [Aspergillus eucalypticola CBS 122712]